MLTPEEQEKLNFYLGITKIWPKDKKSCMVTTEDMRWFVKRLGEVNDELKTISKERDTLQKQYVEGP